MPTYGVATRLAVAAPCARRSRMLSHPFQLFLMRFVDPQRRRFAGRVRRHARLAQRLRQSSAWHPAAERLEDRLLLVPTLSPPVMVAGQSLPLSTAEPV